MNIYFTHRKHLVLFYFKSTLPPKRSDGLLNRDKQRNASGFSVIQRQRQHIGITYTLDALSGVAIAAAGQRDEWTAESFWRRAVNS